MINNPSPFKGLNIRIPIMIPIQGKGDLSIRGLRYHLVFRGFGLLQGNGGVERS